MRQEHGQFAYAEKWITGSQCPICERRYETRQMVLRHIMYDAVVCEHVMQAWQEEQRIPRLSGCQLTDLRRMDVASASSWSERSKLER
eukprot:10269043-Prorocentrum_lima.AAC.1